MTQPIADEYQTATLINGLPTVTFRSQPYHRTVTNLVLNGPGTVNVYRGQLNSVPVALNQLGTNTASGRITLPAGQVMYVQWSGTVVPVSSAFARVSWSKTDNPLGVDSTAVYWDVTPVTSITVPTGSVGPRIVIGSDLPPELVTYYATQFSGYVVKSAILFYFNTTDYYYWTDIAMGFDLVAQGFGIGGVIHEDQNYNWQSFNSIVLRLIGDITPQTTFVGAFTTPRAPSADEVWEFLSSVTLKVDGPANLNGTNILGNGTLGSTDLRGGYSYTNNTTRPLPRGDVVNVAATAGSAATGTTEVVVATTALETYYVGRAYDLHIGGLARSNTGAATLSIKVRETNLAGAIVADNILVPTQAALANVSFYVKPVVANNTASNIATTFVLTIASTVAANTVLINAATATPRFFNIRDCGDAAHHPEAVAL